MMKVFGLSLLTLLVSVGSNGFSQSKPPATYIDKGACPFECCTYRRWKTEKTTNAYSRPNRESTRVGKFTSGTRVVALTGEVRTVASRFTITKNHGKYKRGDVLWVYTPIGEGFYKVWFNGRIYEEGLDYIEGPFETSYPTCEETPDCWGKLDKPLKVEWWVKIRSADGWVGWTNQAENFSGKDSCG
jgi:hypothetical protein